MSLSYGRPGTKLARGQAADPEVIRALQTDLRRLGYLRSGLDGGFGPETERAVRALQADLLFNDGRGPDGRAPVALKDLNRGRITAVSGVVDEHFVACVEDLLGSPQIPQLPRADDPVAENQRVVETIRSSTPAAVPVPFLLAILRQESGLLHFRVPAPGDPDTFIVVGLDRNDATNRDRVTSRGYGVGQYTLFHHPPRPDEVQGVMMDPVKNVQRAMDELREKFDGFVTGETPGTRADDRIAEIGAGALRPCRYEPGDPRFQSDCRQCALAAPRVNLGASRPLFRGSTGRIHPTPNHPERAYQGVPDRAAFGCDWPYAVRRYNGGGVDSYHYQAQVLLRFVKDPKLDALLGPS